MDLLDLCIHLECLLQKHGNIPVFCYAAEWEGENKLYDCDVIFREGHEEIPDRILIDLG